MKNLVIATILVIVAFFSLIYSDKLQEKYYPEAYYSRKIKELEEKLNMADKSIQFHYELFKSAEKSAQTDYDEHLKLLYETEPNVSRDSLKIKARNFISQNVSRFYNSLQNVIDERNEIHRKLKETKRQLSQIRNNKRKKDLE